MKRGAGAPVIRKGRMSKVLYKEDFSNGPARWESVHGEVGERHLADWTGRGKEGRVWSESLYPDLWWKDYNHTNPLNLVLFTQVGYEHGGRNNITSLSGASWHLRLKVGSIWRQGERVAGWATYGARMVVWVQTYDDQIGRWTNIAMTGKPIIDSQKNILLPDETWVDWAASPSVTDWETLGVNPSRLDFYGVGDVGYELAHIQTDKAGPGAAGFGVFLIGVNPQSPPVGRIELGGIEILQS